MVCLKSVYKCFGEVRAVDGLSLEAHPGEVFGLLGPNGAGKSTAIRMIMNIYPLKKAWLRVDCSLL